MPKGIYIRTKEPSNKRLDVRDNSNEIIRLYCQDLMSCEKIGGKYGCSSQIIYGILKRNNKIMNTSERKKLLYANNKVPLNWMKGLTKESSDKVLRLSNKLHEVKKEMFITGTLKIPNNLGRKHSLQIRNKLSNIRKGWKMPESGKEKLRHRKPWNVGLTRKTSPLVDNMSKKIAISCKGMNMGHKITEHTRRLLMEIGKTRVGDKNPAWIDGRSFMPYTKEFNKAFKEAIKIRDGFLCLKCNMRHEDAKKLLKCGLHVHHVDYNKFNTIKENCCALCLRCNSEVNSNRKHWTKFFQSILAERYGYEYSKDGEVIINIQ